MPEDSSFQAYLRFLVTRLRGRQAVFVEHHEVPEALDAGVLAGQHELIRKGIEGQSFECALLAELGIVEREWHMRPVVHLP